MRKGCEKGYRCKTADPYLCSARQWGIPVDALASSDACECHCHDAQEEAQDYELPDPIDLSQRAP